MASQEELKTEKIKTDIVIIGGGASGLCAAVSAAEAGAKDIVVLEKAKTTGGNCRVSVGFFAAESPVQKRLGINISRDEMFRHFMEFNHWKTDGRLVRAWLNRTGELVSWLEGKGLKITTGESPFYPGRDSSRWHMLQQREGEPPDMVGKAIVETLTKECRKLGIRIILGARASKITTDKKQNIAGVIATTKDKEYRIAARSAVIATGGFARNKKLLKKYFPLYNENMYSHSLPQMTGDGLIMAEEAGATIDNTTMALVFFGPHHYAWNSHLTYLHRIPELLRVNKKGERYTSEFTDGAFDSSNALTRQPDAISYTLFDAKIKQEILDTRKPSGPYTESFTTKDNWLDIIEEDIEKEVAKGRAKIAGSLEEIAGFIGCSPEVLKAEIERYNSFCYAGYDADFLKDREYLWPLSVPPYYAIMSSQGFDVPVGGIKINHRLEVLNKKDDAIGGLYATGNDAGCVHGGIYSGGAGAPGCDLSFALCSGCIAGENAAGYVAAGVK